MKSVASLSREMSNKSNKNNVPTISCQKFNKHVTSFYSKNDILGQKPKFPKKVVISKKWHQNCSHEVKSQSAAVIDDVKEDNNKNRKTTKSEQMIIRNGKKKPLDFIKKSGDYDESSIITAVSKYSKKSKVDPTTEEKHTKIIKNVTKNSKNPIQEYYKNDRFEEIYDSTHEMENGFKKLTLLDTIKEIPEKNDENHPTDSNIYIIDTSEDSFDDSKHNIKQLKEFREKNYFECHSAKARINTKGSVTELNDHKCKYRFYLNDRLFPVAVNDDYNDEIRCVDCHLPLDLERDVRDVNGMIQAKVKMGSETQDMTLLLPVKEPLIIKQRRKGKKMKNDDVCYFGIVKLDQSNSVFGNTLPSDSLALKYQKGYREFDNLERYSFEKVNECDVIVI